MENLSYIPEIKSTWSWKNKTKNLMVNHTYAEPTVSTEEAGWAWVELSWKPQGTGMGLLSPAECGLSPALTSFPALSCQDQGGKRLRRLAQGVLEA